MSNHNYRPEHRRSYDVGVKHNRRFTDRTLYSRFKDIMLDSDISFTMIFLGVALILCGFYGCWRYVNTHTYSNNSELISLLLNGEPVRYFAEHIVAGVIVIFLALRDLPNPYTVLTAAWLIFLWSNVLFSDKGLFLDTYIDKIVAINYITLAGFMIQRTRKYTERRKN